VDLSLSAEQVLLRDTFAELFGKESGSARVRACEPLGFDETLWARLVELGAPTMGVTPALGGGGAQCVDLVLLAREVGRHVAPVPFVEAAVTANLLGRVGAAQAVAAVAGGAVPTLALAAPADGRCRLVQAGAVADIIVVLDGTELVALRREGRRPHVASPPNLGSSPIADVDIGDPGLERVVLADGLQALAHYNDAVAEWKLLMSAALDGVRAAALEMTVAYVKERHAFGAPLGWFQAVQHRLADSAVAGDGGNLLVHKAAWARDAGQPEAAELAGMSFLFMSELSFATCKEAVQLHGGYGYTLEYDVQLLFRRARSWPLALGDPSREYQRLAARLFPESEALPWISQS
jgi:alkylation response protein AidB-like acyl-CoA dehydrogenase